MSRAVRRCYVVRRRSRLGGLDSGVMDVSGRGAAEGGYILAAVILLVALLTLSLTVAIPPIVQEIRRDRELECIHRGKQYARAIRLFYRRTGNYPTDMSQLLNFNGERFLRKRYLDPITNSEWKLVYQGEVKPEVLADIGFFGGPSVTAPRGPMPNGVIAGLASGTPSGVNGYGGNGGVTQLLDPLTGQPVNSSGSSASPSPSGSQAGAQNGTSDSTDKGFSGRRIVGVSPTSPKASIFVFKKQTHYNDWQFVYNPATEGIVGGAQPGLTLPNAEANSPATAPQSSPVPQQ